MNLVLSIVIPTKNRITYLKYILDYFNKIEGHDIELVVQDNSDYDVAKELSNYIGILHDNRIVYNHEEGRLSQKENCDKAIHNARGHYVLMLGDDDVFSKYLLDYCRKWRLNNIDTILTNKPAYFWPDVTPRLYKDRLSATFVHPHFTSKETLCNIADIKKAFIKTGGTEIGEMPRVYHGIVSKKCLENIYQQCGSYCPGPSPDIANAIALLYIINSFLFVDIPLVVSGQCIKSAGGKGSQGEHYDEVENVKQLPLNQTAKWFDFIPFYWSGKTIYAQSAFETLDELKLTDVAHQLNKEYMLASCMVFDSKYSDRILKCILKNGKRHIPKTLFYYVVIWIKRITFHFKNNLVLFKVKKM